jgi:S-adenosylmethionine synthetase
MNPGSSKGNLMTKRNIRVETGDRRAVEDQAVEIVERKGVGHPDSICDGIAERVSRHLSRLYRDRVGEVLHYNTDETQLVAGSAQPAFGGGEVTEPIYLLITGRATSEYGGQRLPVETTALEAAREYLREEVPLLDYGRDVIVDVKLGEGSGDLRHVFDDANGEGESIAADGVGAAGETVGTEGAVSGAPRTGSVPMANDTSFGVGHAPLTETERIVLETERRLNRTYAADHPEVGPDVKVMGKRETDTIDLTVAVAMIDRHVPDLEAYVDAVAGVEAFVRDVARSYTDREVTVAVNTADVPEEESVYLTVTGTSAEQGDDGSVGRGNRSNGLITPNRPMSMEATSGKNPVNHIGKIYNLLSTEIARSVVDEVDGIRDLRVRLLSQIGQPIDRPQVADANVVTEPGVDLDAVEDDIVRIVDRELADVRSISERAIQGELTTF